VNDDGPPSDYSPYIATFVRALQQAGHVTSVVLPNMQSSGMAKAYNFGQVLQPVYYTPDLADDDDGRTPDRWILVNGTPASCVQLGVHHLFQDRGPIDLVISGPNYGHNLTSVYNLASGTVGGAMEAALCGKKAVSLSFAFGNHRVPGDDGVPSAELIATASRISIDLIENLLREPRSDVEVYHINIPQLRSTLLPQAVWTTAVRSSLSSPSIFQPLDKPEASSSLQAFTWAPKFSEVKRGLEEAPPGTDVWALKEGYIRLVT
jgi:tubulin---tyrosine ligase